MMKKEAICFLLLYMTTAVFLYAQRSDQSGVEHRDTIFQPITEALRHYLQPVAAATGILRVTKTEIDDQMKVINITYSTTLSEYPFRPEFVKNIYNIAVPLLPARYQGYTLRIFSGGKEISEWTPVFYKETPKTKQNNKKATKTIPLKTNLSQPYQMDRGLQNRHIALWQSHGYYYAQNVDRWEWQRARIFQTVEDLYTQSYVLPFLVPMLENAGAVTLMPRERDTQINEVIVDNDMPTTRYYEQTGAMRWSTPDDSGFAHLNPFYVDGENPFQMGTYRQIETVIMDKKGSTQPSYAIWQADIPESGSYVVYISYKSLEKSAPDASYTVFHKGGQTSFQINQTMGGGTWIYLGHFEFDKGISDQCKVILSNTSTYKNKIITADAIKFGGGMGNIGRSEPPMLSNYPRFTEGSRYWLQWAGAPDSVYTPNNSRNDYNDDYMSRGRWVNYLSGSSSANPGQKGLGIPIDLSLAFHTDAGTTLTDSIIGTLGIYTSLSEGSTLLADGRSRFISRDLTDLVQTQIVQDIRATYEPTWMRRGIWDRSYAESRSPNVPAMLLELLSHQNFADMRYGLDPNFRFTVSRAIYKGILKFLSSMDGTPYVVQPLPVERFSLTFASDHEALLQWQPVEDPLEPSATAQSYIIYTRVDDGAFDNGILIKTNYLKTNIEQGRTYSFKVSAVNAGGQSFPSEILSIHRAINELGRVLIVNGFDRMAPPASYASTDSLFAGFSDSDDFGVPYLKDISYIGSQYDFRRTVPWTTNDAPGFGASHATYETKVLAGNSFDYPLIHGRAYSDNSYSYASCSQKAFMQDTTLSTGYNIVDLILGKQRQTVTGTGFSGVRYAAFPPMLQTRLAQFCHSGGNLLISGAFVASDLWDAPQTDSLSQQFATNLLKYKWSTGNATETGKVKSAPSPFSHLFSGSYTFYTMPNPISYWVESPDALLPSTPEAHTIFRYADNNKSAGVAYSGSDYKTVVLGFPIETIIDESERSLLIKNILQFFHP